MSFELSRCKRRRFKKHTHTHAGVHFVKINDKKVSKQYNVKTYPALTYFRNKEPIAYEGIVVDLNETDRADVFILHLKWYLKTKQRFSWIGDLLDEEQVLEFLTSLEAMDLPDQIEEVNAKILEKIVADTGYVAVLFCK